MIINNQLVENIVKWIKDRVNEAKAKGIVIGLSGGVDSSVVAVLCKMAVDKNLLGIIMPCDSEDEEINDAYLIAKKFEIKTKKINLNNIYDAFVNALPKGDKVSLGNIKARIRMTILYYFANKLNYLVAGTGNKSEIMIGYFTKYGDGGVDILPIGNLLKTEVYELAKLLNIPEKIINKKPTAGLWKGQTDEDEIGIPYSLLDKAIISLETGKKLCEQEVIDKVKNYILLTEHKRKPIPIYKQDL